MKRSRAELARLADVISGFKAKPADNSGELQDQINKLNHLNAHLRLALSTLNKEKVVLEANDSITVTSNVDNSADVILSVLEIS